MSEWQSPQDYPRRETDGIKRLVDAVASTSRQVRESTSNLLRTAGIYVTEAGMRVARSLLVEGDLEVTGGATFSGDTEIGGNARITGTLSLPAGIIDNEALASPVSMASSFGSNAGFAIPTAAWTEVAAATIVIPPGFTEMQFVAAAMVNVVNSTSGTQNVYIQTRRQVNGAGTVYNGPQASQALPAASQGATNAFYIWNEQVTPGDSHRFAIEVWVSGGFAVSPNNYGRIDVSAMFTR